VEDGKIGNTGGGNTGDRMRNQQREDQDEDHFGIVQVPGGKQIETDKDRKKQEERREECGNRGSWCVVSVVSREMKFTH